MIGEKCRFTLICNKYTYTCYVYISHIIYSYSMKILFCYGYIHYIYLLNFFFKYVSDLSNNNLVTLKYTIHINTIIYTTIYINKSINRYNILERDVYYENVLRKSNVY